MEKKRFRAFSVALCLILLLSLSSYLDAMHASADAGVDITTHHNNNQRTGANLNETILNTSNVNADGFGKLFAKAVDGQIYAQPLILSGMNVGGTTRNVVYVATMHNTVYCFDADDGSAGLLWSKNLGPSVPMPDPNIGQGVNFKDIIGEIGILSTPVISRSNNALYVVAMTKTNGVYEHKLHALDLTNGNEKFSGPKKITASVSGNGDGGTTVTWNSQQQNQRLALTLANGNVYFAAAGYEDKEPYHGWVLGYNAATLAQTVVFNSSPGGQGAGIWQSGQGLSVDSNGNLFFMTGNGVTDAVYGSNLGEAFIKLSGSSPAAVSDWFIPYNYATLNMNDTDLGSSGVLLLPGTNLMLGGGKEGKLYVLDTGNLGHYQAGSDSQIVQSFMATQGHIHGSPVYWQGPNDQRVYIWSESDKLKAFQFNGSTLNTTPVTQSTYQAAPGMPGGFLAVSANGSAAGSGIVWANNPYMDDANHATVEGVLHAFDASDLSREIWNSKMNDVRDHLGNFAKFVPPTVANGKVYMATFSNQLIVYGLLNQGNYRLKNRWTGQYMHIEHLTGKVEVSYLGQPDWLSAQWTVENADNGFVRFKNKKTGDYLHMEDNNGTLEYGSSVQPGWYSAQWKMTDTVNGYKLINSRWQTDQYIHIEDQLGYAQVGLIDTPEWYSAQWMLEPVN